MAAPTQRLPRGIRNNNPGNLRSACDSRYHTTREDGFARFRTPHDGLVNLAACARSFYYRHHLTTVSDFINRYAPPTENQTADYVAFVARYLRISPALVAKEPMRLDRLWRMVDLMRAIIAMENGPTPQRYSVGGEWFGPCELSLAINDHINADIGEQSRSHADAGSEQ